MHHKSFRLSGNVRLHDTSPHMMPKSFGWFALVLLAGACAEGVTGRVSPDGTRTFGSPDGDRLTAPSSEAPEEIVKGFLREVGVAKAAVDGLAVESVRRSARTGRAHVRLRQEVGGLRVHGAYVKATVDADGRLVHLIDATARPAPGAPAAAAIDERAAVDVAVAAHHPRSPDVRRGADYFLEPPSARRVLVAGAGGALAEAFLVETWSRADNRLHHTLVGGAGRVLDVEERTSADRYHVFPVSPERTPQVTVAGGPGWLAEGAHTSLKIGGNNVRAYLDANADGAPDDGGAEIADGDFSAVYDPAIDPAVGVNRDVAVQNLFYLNNLVHDTLHAAGFDEAAGNFQQDNFGRGGVGGDPVSAEAQDGGGQNNANFATPPDGRSPRMQMYLWAGLGDHHLVVHAPATVAATYKAQRGQFAPALSATGLRADVVLVDDGQAPQGGTPHDACEPLAELAGKIALVDRGLCPFVQKVKHAQDAGAVAVIVANHQGGDALMVMGGSDPAITIPAVLVTQDDGARLKAATAVQATLRLADPPLLARDGDLDADIVWHEYGHGLTWRMIGNMSGAMSGALGEGMSDVLAVIMNEDDAVGEYAASDPRGIRSARYSELERTYGDFRGNGVHFEGELYGAIAWRLFETFRAAGIPKTVLLGYLVDGMNYTKQGPAFEDMRDGILQAAAGTGHECLVWRAFAAYGVGVDAMGVVRGPRIYVNDSKAVPPECGP
jgi:extracellular elastinolytic metalloproteinase